MSEDSLTDEQLAWIETRANAATAGPWRYSPSWQGNPARLLASPGTENESRLAEFKKDADAGFVALSREDVPALVAEVRRLRADYETVRVQRSTALKSVEELQRRIDKAIEATDYGHGIGDTSEDIRAAFLPSTPSPALEAVKAETTTEITDEMVERAAQRMFAPDSSTAGDFEWFAMVHEDASQADIWREDARKVLKAALHPVSTEGEGQ